MGAPPNGGAFLLGTRQNRHQHPFDKALLYREAGFGAYYIKHPYGEGGCLYIKTGLYYWGNQGNGTATYEAQRKTPCLTRSNRYSYEGSGTAGKRQR